MLAWDGIGDADGNPIDPSPEAIDARFEQWTGKGVRVVREPYDEVFGRTFLVADPDGNLIRVAPVD